MANRNGFKYKNTKKLLNLIQQRIKFCRFKYRLHKNITSKLCTIEDSSCTNVSLKYLRDCLVRSSILNKIPTKIY